MYIRHTALSAALEVLLGRNRGISDHLEMVPRFLRFESVSYTTSMKRVVFFWLANMILALHFSFAVFVLIGWYFESVTWLYYIAMISWFYSWFLLGFCPLTKWEFLLRKYYDDSIDVNREFITYHLDKQFGVTVEKERILFIGGLLWVTLLGLSIWV
jgi:hypothetical protein